MSRSFARMQVARAAVALTALIAAAPAAAATTTVSLTFDDGRATQFLARGPLASNGLRATFYINSQYVGGSGYYMTWQQLRDLGADGNEIAGHTTDHTNLTQVDATRQRELVCNDRQALLGQGFSPVVSFAYPFAAVNDSAKQAVSGCGYSSGRGAGGIRSVDRCGTCPFAEQFPPPDPYRLRTPDFTGTTIPLSTMQQYVTQAEQNGGGWVILGFHSVCSSCDQYNASVTQENLAAFAAWLKQREGIGTVVRTVGEVMSGGTTPPPPPPPTADSTAPVTAIACNGSACATGNYKRSVSVTLQATDSGSGVNTTWYTTDGSTPSASNGHVYSGAFTLTRTAAVKFRSIDNAGNLEAVRSKRVRVK